MLLPKPEPNGCSITIENHSARIINGKLSCLCSDRGWLEFSRDGHSVLREYERDGSSCNGHSVAMHFPARAFTHVSDTDYSITTRFEAVDGEKFFGMGQYQQPQMNLKGCVLELMQRNSQISIPFCLSSQGYGFLWNSASIGEVMFGANYTQWQGYRMEELDYWITADDSPKQILKNYTEVTGRAPAFPDNALGLWQSKLRYRTQDEVLEVAREYKRRGIPLDVIVIDFFHWIRQGDWDFDPAYWPDPAAMVRELREMGIRCMVSVWPTVDKRSVHFSEMNERGYFIRDELGTRPNYFDFQGECQVFDALNPKARSYVFEKINGSYGSYGIDLYWLDLAEPESSANNRDGYRHETGPAMRVGNEYPKAYARTFYEGLRAQGKEDIVTLIRCAWVGSQRYGALVWSGDINSNFITLRDQVQAGLNIGIAGIPWWTTDTGGFIGNVNDPHFKELLIRWFEFSTFSPVLRLHGDHGPHDIPRLSNLDYGGGFTTTGRPHEMWSYGEEVCDILRKYLDLRLSMKDYIASLFREASENGSPLLRAMFYEFPDDPHCWELYDQYMFGSRYLVAPVLYQGMTERQVYLPEGSWRNLHTGETLAGKQTVTADAPLEIIPVFEKLL